LTDTVCTESVYSFSRDEWRPIANDEIRNQNYTNGYIQTLLLNSQSDTLFAAGAFQLFSLSHMHVDLASVGGPINGWELWPDINVPENAIYGVNCLVVNGTTLYAGGYFVLSECGAEENAGYCNSVVGILNATEDVAQHTANHMYPTMSMNTGTLDGEVLCMTMLGSYLFVGGVFSIQLDGQSLQNYLVWDNAASAWDLTRSAVFRSNSFLGSIPTAFAVRSVPLEGEWVYMALRNPDGTSSVFYSKDSGISWTLLPDSIAQGEIVVIHFSKLASLSVYGDIYVGGKFTQIGEVSVFSIARASFQNATNIASWNALPELQLGYVVLPYVWTILENHTAMYVSGLFYGGGQVCACDRGGLR